MHSVKAPGTDRGPHGRSAIVRATKAVVLATLGLAAMGNAMANLLTNPGFESAEPFGAGTNWVASGENQLLDCGQAHGGNCSLQSSQNGAVASGSMMLQFVDSVAGQEYELSFWFMRYRNAFFDTVRGSYQVRSGDVGSFVTVLEGDLSSDTTWAQAGGLFHATGPRTRISFRGDDFGQNAMNFDGFVLTPVPEPQTGILFLAGLGVVLAGLRRRARALQR